MRRLLALATIATAAVATAAVVAAAPADAAYTCVPENSNTAVCVQVIHCADECLIDPGVYVQCYLGFRGEPVCQIVRLLGFELGG